MSTTNCDPHSSVFDSHGQEPFVGIDGGCAMCRESISKTNLDQSIFLEKLILES